jgi:riboflavin synthase
MFTGLIEAVGVVRGATGAAPRRLTVASAVPVEEVSIGDSVAIDGACLTVVEKGAGTLSFEAATETLARTTVGDLTVGDRVHLERSLPMGGRLDGHLVMGHVDGIGRVTALDHRGSALYLGVDAPGEVVRLTAPRGSIAIAGCSLTVTAVRDATLSVALIPHTLAATRFGELRIGDRVNLEADLLARYVDRLLGARQPGGSLTVETLKDKGFA